MNIMKIAVLMSTYNGEKYVKEQIDSILLQKDVDVYLYIRDDGSTDDSVSIIESFNDSRIKLFSQKNQGPSSARNLGIEKAQNYANDLCEQAIAVVQDLPRNGEILTAMARFVCQRHC